MTDLSDLGVQVKTSCQDRLSRFVHFRNSLLPASFNSPDTAQGYFNQVLQPAVLLFMQKIENRDDFQLQ